MARWSSIALVLFLAACATKFVPPETPPTVPYVVQPGDTLAIKFYYHADHDIDATVRTDGKLLLPLVGEIPAAGSTPAELSAVIERAYSRNLRDPRVAVAIKTMNQDRVFVGGEVNKPGFVPYRPGLTALQALLEAGGPKDTARIDEVVVIQNLNQPQYRASKLNLKKALGAGDVQENVRLSASDVVFVPKTTIAKLNQFVEQYIIKMMPIKPGMGFPL